MIFSLSLENDFKFLTPDDKVLSISSFVFFFGKFHSFSLDHLSMLSQVFDQQILGSKIIFLSNGHLDVIEKTLSNIPRVRCTFDDRILNFL